MVSQSCEEVPVGLSLHRILSKDVVSPLPVPHYPASIKDGYAVRSCDTLGAPKMLRLISHINSRAGDVHNENQLPLVTEGTAMYVTTGGVLPPGADAVLMHEHTEQDENDPRALSIQRMVEAGEEVRPIGSDIPLGTTILTKGTRVGPVEIGLLSMVNIDQVEVYAKPVVGVFSTGNEVIKPNGGASGLQTAVPFGKVCDANRPVLLAALQDPATCAAAVKDIDMGIVGDEAEDITNTILDAFDTGCDVLITSGGVSQGDKDLVKVCLESIASADLSVDFLFDSVIMKPGKPVAYAVISSKASKTRMRVLCLPGNPVSSMATFHLFMAPLLGFLAGSDANRSLTRVHAYLEQDVKGDPTRPDYHRVSLRSKDRNGSVVLGATSTGRQISSRLLSMKSAVALVEVPQGRGLLRAGTLVSALLIGDMRASLAGQWGEQAEEGMFKLAPTLVNPAADASIIRPGPNGYHKAPRSEHFEQGVQTPTLSGGAGAAATGTTATTAAVASFLPLKDRVDLEAFAFDRLVDHFRARSADVANIDVMNLAGFCRNCLAKW
jgi:gephyrin